MIKPDNASKGESVMHLGWPQAILCTLILCKFGMAIAKNGEPMGTWNFGYSVLSTSLSLSLLWWGGFFS